MGVEHAIDLTATQRRTVLALLKRHLPGTAAWVYGSRAKWTSTPQSDLDLVVFAKPEQQRQVGDLREAFDESTLPFRVDLFVWDDVPESFRDGIESEHTVLGVASSRIDRGRWREKTLGEVITLKRGYDLPQRRRRDGTVPVVSSSGVSDYHSEPKVSGPGVVTGRYGTLGKVFFIQDDFWPLNTVLYVQDFRGNDPRFISYFLRSIDFFSYSDKAAVPGINRNHLHEQIVRIPDTVGEQRAIGQILGSLDDKIELNRRMSATLEAMARALFKSWFVDFDPVRAKGHGRHIGLARRLLALFPESFDNEGRPQGWSNKPLDEVAEFLNGLAMQKFPPSEVSDSLPVIRISELRSGITPRTRRASRDIPSEYVVRDGDFLFSWSGSLLAKFWTGGEGALNQHLFKVTSGRYPMWFCGHWVYHHLEDFQAIAASKATTMGHIQRGHLKQAMATCPPDGVVAELGHSMEVLVDRVIKTELESRTLVEIRDHLLSKLITGELRVMSDVSGRDGST